MSAARIPCHACGAVPLPPRRGRPSQVADADRRRILAARLLGHGYAEIARWLDDIAVPTPRGAAKWDRSTVRYIALGGETP